MSKTFAIVVTYNRKLLLSECIEAITKQTIKPEKTFIIDNASTDGTKEFLEEKGIFNDKSIEYIKQDKNSGGAGGFYRGFQESIKQDFDFLWVMDDDTIPEKTCLEELLKAASITKKDSSFIASSIYGPNGEFLNVPKVNDKKSPNGYDYWYEELENALVNIKDATFVSLLINKKAIDKCGLPCKDFFIWGDDTEYTTRIINNYGPAYICGKSKAIHKRANCMALKIKNETNISRIKMFHYFYRNTAIINYNYKGFLKMLKFIIRQFLYSYKLLFSKYGFIKFATIQKGLFESLIYRKKFTKFIRSQISK